MPELSFCQADKSDVPAIFSLCKDLINRYEDLAGIDYEKVLSWVKNKIVTNISSYTCVYWGGVKVAYYCLSEQPDGLELDDLYVLEPYRSRGIGSQILHRCIAQAKSRLYLYVFKKNDGAIRLYERQGFIIERPVGTTRLIMCLKG